MGQFSSMHQSIVKLDLMYMDCQQLRESIFAASCFLSSLTASLMSDLGEVAQDMRLLVNLPDGRAVG